MTKEAGPKQAADPFDMWRQLYEANERAWTTALEQAMGSAEFGESSGKMLETMLAAQKAVRDNMRSYLETMNVPTREDIARLGELVVGLEEKVDQVLDRLDEFETSMSAATGQSARAAAGRSMAGESGGSMAGESAAPAPKRSSSATN